MSTQRQAEFDTGQNWEIQKIQGMMMGYRELYGFEYGVDYGVDEEIA